LSQPAPIRGSASSAESSIVPSQATSRRRFEKVCNVSRVVQQRLFKAALDELAVIGEPINRVLEVDLDGEEVTLTLYDLPAR
jgi:hypothetical protein